MRYATLVFALALAGPAAAQTTTTQCHNYFGTLSCESQTLEPPAYPSRSGFNSAMDSYERLQQQSAIERAQQTRRRVGGLIAQGRCDDARTVALRAGDLDLAQQVAQACTPPAH